MLRVTSCHRQFRKLSLITPYRDFTELLVTTGNKKELVTKKEMEAALLVQKLSERGIKLKVADGLLTCDSEQPIPKAVMTTIDAEKKQLVEYLGSLNPSDQQPVIPLTASAEQVPSLNKCNPEKTADNGAYRTPTPQGTALPLTTEALPRLPWQLEALLRAAASDLLPKRGAVTLEAGLVTDLNSYTLAWAASYLTGDQAEALRRLWQGHRAWQGGDELMSRNSTQHRDVMTPQDAVKLLTNAGVHAAVVWRGETRGLSIDSHNLMDALTALPDDERLPPQLEALLEAARENADRAMWEPLVAIGGAYLIGLPGDRRGALSMLWAAHEQWKRVN